MQIFWGHPIDALVQVQSVTVMQDVIAS